MCDDLAHGGRRCPGCRSGGRKDPALRRARRAGEKVRRAWEESPDRSPRLRPRAGRPGRPAASRYGTIVASTETGRVVAWSDGALWSADAQVMAAVAGLQAHSPVEAMACMRSVLERLGDTRIDFSGDLPDEGSERGTVSMAAEALAAERAAKAARGARHRGRGQSSAAQSQTDEHEEDADGSRWVTAADQLTARTARVYAQQIRGSGYEVVLADSDDLYGSPGTWDVQVLVPAGQDATFPPPPAPADLEEEARLEREADLAHEMRRIDRLVGTDAEVAHRAWLAEQLVAARAGHLVGLGLPGVPPDPAYWAELIDHFASGASPAGASRPVLDLKDAAAIEDGDAPIWQAVPAAASSAADGPGRGHTTPVTITAYAAGSAAAAKAYAAQLTASGWSAWAHPATADRPLGRRNSWVVTVTAPEGTTPADLPQRQKVKRRSEEEVIATEVRERHELLIGGAEDDSERAESIAGLRGALAEAEGGGSRREAAILRGVLALVDDAEAEAGQDGTEEEEDDDDDAWLSQANTALQAHIAARRPAPSASRRPGHREASLRAGRALPRPSWPPAQPRSPRSGNSPRRRPRTRPLGGTLRRRRGASQAVLGHTTCW